MLYTKSIPFFLRFSLWERLWHLFTTLKSYCYCSTNDIYTLPYFNSSIACIDIVIFSLIPVPMILTLFYTSIASLLVIRFLSYVLLHATPQFSWLPLFFVHPLSVNTSNYANIIWSSLNAILFFHPISCYCPSGRYFSQICPNAR